MTATRCSEREMAHQLIDTGDSRSFPAPHKLAQTASSGGELVVLIGRDAGAAFAKLGDVAGKAAVLIELGTECLGLHADESAANVLGFARFRLGDGAPSDLVELVRQSASSDAAI